MHTTISKCYKSGLPTPESLLLSICQHTTACRLGEKFVLIGMKGHWRGFELGNNYRGQTPGCKKGNREMD